jgi:hypothetical protein
MSDRLRAELKLEPSPEGSGAAPASLRNMLRAGDSYGDFFIQTIDGRVLDIDTFKNQKLWVALYRYGGCPMCATHFTEVIAARETLEKNNVAFIAVFDCAANQIPTWVQKSASRSLFVVGEGSDQLQSLFGSERSWSKLFSLQSAWARIKVATQGYFEHNLAGAFERMPSHFLIDKTGHVEVAHYGEHAGDHVSWTKVQEFFRRDGVNSKSSPDALKAPAPKTVQESEPTQSTEGLTESPPTRHEATSRPKGFVVLYRYRLFTGMESEFANEWQRLETATSELHTGYMGSTLHFSTMNEWIVYAVWRSRAEWEVYEVTQTQTAARRLYSSNIVEREGDPIFMCVRGRTGTTQPAIDIFDDEKTVASAKIS